MKLRMPALLRASWTLGPGKRFFSRSPLVRYNITVCQERKVLWYRVAKVGTRTIYNAFEKAGADVYDQQVMFYSRPANLYPDYFSFAFIRNPWDRLVSCWKDKVLAYNYFQLSSEEHAKMKRFHYFVECLQNADIDHADPHLRPQSRLVAIDNLDFVGHFENFSGDLQQVLRKLQADEISIKKLNASANRKNYRKYYDDELQRKVAHIYRQDIERFAYEF